MSRKDSYSFSHFITHKGTEYCWGYDGAVWRVDDPKDAMDDGFVIVGQLDTTGDEDDGELQKMFADYIDQNHD